MAFKCSFLVLLTLLRCLQFFNSYFFFMNCLVLTVHLLLFGCVLLTVRHLVVRILIINLPYLLQLFYSCLPLANDFILLVTKSYLAYLQAGRIFAFRTPPQELMNFIMSWTVPYQKLLVNQQRAARFIDCKSKVVRQHPVGKAVTLINEGKNKSAQ